MSALRIALGIGSVAAAIVCFALMVFAADPTTSSAASETLCLTVCGLATGILATLVWPRHRLLLHILMLPVAICAGWFLWTGLDSSASIAYTASSFLAAWIAYCSVSLSDDSSRRHA